MDFSFSFLRHLYLAPRKRFLFIDLAIIIKDTKNQGATCTTSNATRARRVLIDIKGTSFSSNSRYPMFISVWNDASKRVKAIREKKDSNERGGIDRTRRLFIVLKFFVSELWIFYSLLFLCLFITFFDWGSARLDNKK
jgi:hypothetical protein